MNNLIKFLAVGALGASVGNEKSRKIILDNLKKVENNINKQINNFVKKEEKEENQDVSKNA